MNFLKLETGTPCNVGISEMNPNSNGYYCGQCNSNVIEMSDWSEEKIMEFFNKNHEKVCARIRADLTERVLFERIKQSKRISFSHKIITLFFTFFGLSSLTLKAQNKSISIQEQIELDKKKNKDLITISGNISKDGIPVSGVKITYLGKTYYSDTLGNYNIILEKSEARDCQIHFIHSSMPFQARSYKVSMESVRFNIEYYSLNLKELPTLYTGYIIPRYNDTIKIIKNK